MSSALRGLAPDEGLELGLMKTGRTGPLVSHAAGHRQASLGTPVPRTPTKVVHEASQAAYNASSAMHVNVKVS